MLFEGSLGLLGGSLGSSWGSQGRSSEALGGAWAAFLGPGGCLGGAYEAIGGIIKTLKNHWFFKGFEHLEVLGRALELILEPWGLL